MAMHNQKYRGVEIHRLAQFREKWRGSLALKF